MIPIGQARLAGNLNADDMVMLAGKQYPMDKAKRVYEKLTQHNVNDYDIYHESPNIRGYAKSTFDDVPILDIRFVRKDSNGNWSYQTPENLPVPTRELIDLKRNFDKFAQQNPAIYSNTPTSEHRAKAYRKQGFVDTEPESGYANLQVKDARRFQNSPAVQDLYSVMDRTALTNEFINPDTFEKISSALEKSRANQLEQKAAKLQAQQAVNLVDAAIATPVIAATPQQRAKFVINKATGQAESFIDRGEGYVPYKTMSIEDARTAYAKARDAGWGVEHEMV